MRGCTRARELRPALRKSAEFSNGAAARIRAGGSNKFASAAVFSVAIVVGGDFRRRPAGAATYYDTQSHTWVPTIPDKCETTPLGAPVEPRERGRPDCGRLSTRIEKSIRNSTVRSSPTTRPKSRARSSSIPGQVPLLRAGGRQGAPHGLGVGREGFGWTGVVQIGSKQENPNGFRLRDGRAPAGTGEVHDRRHASARVSSRRRALYLNDEGQGHALSHPRTIEPGPSA